MTDETHISKFKNIFKGRKFKRNAFYVLMMTFPVVHFIIFYIVVNFNSFFLAFREYTLSDGTMTWQYSLKHFQTIFYELTHSPQNITMGYMFRNSFLVFAFEILIIVPLSIIFSFYIYKKLPFAKLFKVIIFIPSIITVLALAIVYNATVNNVLPSVFGCEKFLLELYPDRVFGALMVFTLMISFGVNIIMYTSTMSSIDQSLVEAAKIDGAGLGKEFFNITLPACYSTISVFIVVSIAGMFVNQLHAHAFFGSGLEVKLRTVGYFLFVETLKAGTSITQYGYLSAWGLLLSAIVIPLTFTVRWVLKKIGPSED
ncbi:MAG: sugar ABC transporter permease [Clostridia bacterium]|nr:sugar ABC transporter permease [Clostridia bacterium]